MRYPATYARLIARSLRLDAEGQARLLAGTALAPADLAVLDQMLTRAEQLRIVRNAIALAGRADFALDLAARMPIAAHGPLGSLLSASDNLRQAWAALERYHGLRTPGVQIRRSFADQHLAIRLVPEWPRDAGLPDEVALFCLEAMALTVQRGIELILGRRLREAGLAFGYPPPPHAARYAEHFHSPVEFDAPETVIRVPLQLLDQPNPYRDPEVYAQALRQCEQLEEAQRDDASWSLRITRLLQQHPGQLWSLASVAAHLGLSSRTLMRHLKAEGTCYQALLDAELSRQATALLRLPRHTVASVALALGYQDATAFRRAFRRWQGVAPSEWLAAQER